MIIEWLHPDATMLFGDRGNFDLLQNIVPHATLVKTPLFTQPLFTYERVDLVCVGSMSETMQTHMITWLKEYTHHIKHHIAHDLGMLWFGNSGEILGQSIIRNNHSQAGLNLYPFVVTQETIKRYNALVGIDTKYGLVLGHKSTFSQITQTQNLPSFGKVVHGFGYSLNDPFDGLHDHHMIMSECLGPLLVLNPHFTKKYLSELTQQDITLPFEEDLVMAYNAKKQDFERSKHFVYDK